MITWSLGKTRILRQIRKRLCELSIVTYFDNAFLCKISREKHFGETLSPARPRSEAAVILRLL